MYKTATYFNIVVLSDNNSHCLLSMSTKQKGAQSAEKVIPTKQEKNKANYNANRAAISAQKKAYYKANRDAIGAKKKAYYNANRGAIGAQRKANRDSMGAQKKAYYDANRVAISSDVRPFFKFLIWNKSWFASSAGTF